MYRFFFIRNLIFRFWKIFWFLRIERFCFPWNFGWCFCGSFNWCGGHGMVFHGARFLERCLQNFSYHLISQPFDKELYAVTSIFQLISNYRGIHPMLIFFLDMVATNIFCYALIMFIVQKRTC